MQISDSSSMRHTSGGLPFKLQGKKRVRQIEGEKKKDGQDEKNTSKVIFQRREEWEMYYNQT